MNTNKQSEFKTKEDLGDWDIDGVDMLDYPEFNDAYVCYATCKKTGRELTEDELYNLPADLVSELIYQRVYLRVF